jgi:hypothetical protein
VRLLQEVDYDCFGLPGCPVRLLTDRLAADESLDDRARVGRLLREALWPRVIAPRGEALEAIKRGFDLFPLPRLASFSLRDFIAHFSSRTLVTGAELLASLDFSPPADCFAGVVECALRELGPEDRARLLKFSTGSDKYYAHLRVQVSARPFPGPGRYPAYPLPTALTCCNHLFLPVPVQPDGAEGTDLAELRPAACFTPASVLENLRAALDNGVFAEFSDKGALQPIRTAR